MTRLDRQSVLQIALLAVLAVGGAYLLHSLGLVELFLDRRRMVQFMQEHRGSAVLTFIGLQALQVVAAPVPGEATGFVGGYLFGTGAGIFFSTIGLTLGSWAAFLLGRLLGRHVVERLMGAERMRKYDYVMKHRGLFLAFLMFLIPGFPKDMLCYLLGLGHMKQVPFLVISTGGRFFGTVLLTVGGTFFRDQRYGAFATVVGVGVSAVLLALAYRRELERWFRGRRLAQHRSTRARRNGKPANGGVDPPAGNSSRTEP